MSEADIMAEGLKNQVSALSDAKVKLTEDFVNGKLTLDEYNKKMGETQKKLNEAEKASEEFAKGLAIVHNHQDDYITRIEKMKNLKLNPAMFDALADRLKTIAKLAAHALALKAQLLDQAIKNPVVQEVGTRVATSFVPNAGVGKAALTLADKITGGQTSKFLNEKKKDITEFAKNQLKDAQEKLKMTNEQMQAVEDNAKEAKENLEKYQSDLADDKKGKKS